MLSSHIEGFMEELLSLDEETLAEVLADLPEPVVSTVLRMLPARPDEESLPPDPLSQAMEVDPGYRPRAHLEYLSNRLAQAVRDVEAGKSRHLLISMPPRSGKSQMTSVYLPLWLLRKHADWKIGMISHTDMLAVSWGREVRRILEDRRQEYGIEIARDAGAASHWQTTEKGSVTARSAPGQSITGLGFKVLLVDDAVKDFAAAHSEVARKNLWEWWTANAITRLEPPYLVVMIGTRWHESDILGRLLSSEHEGDPSIWEVIKFPALAEESDVLGRAPGEPLISPLLNETPEEALARWKSIRSSVGEYSWAALYQQRPAPPTGGLFDIEKVRYWTLDPDYVAENVTLLTREEMQRGRWIDSWDLTFKGGDGTDFVVGQRWVRVGRRRVLVDQHRQRMGFTDTVSVMRSWAGVPAPGEDRAAARAAAPWGWDRVSETLVESAANGEAVMDSLRAEVSTIRAVRPQGTKVARAHAVTPAFSRGEVLLPNPEEHAWVADYVDELRNFPTAAHDDQVDATTQALTRLASSGTGVIKVPGVSPTHAAVPGLSRLTTGR